MMSLIRGFIMVIQNFMGDIRAFLSARLVCEEANIQPKTTGLVSAVHVMSRGGAKHGPHVKVSKIAGGFSDKDNFSVTVEHEPRVVGTCKIHSKHLKNVIEWVKMNHDHLHAVWYNDGNMDIDELTNGFKHLI